MTSKRTRRSPRWRAPFLRALGLCANVRMAAEQAGVDHTGPYTLRRRDARFAADWQVALEKGRLAVGEVRAAVVEGGGAPLDFARDERNGDRLSGDRRGGSRRRARGRQAGDTASSPVRDVVRVSKRCGPQVVRVGEGRWSAAAEARFLASLCARANVRHACREAGFSTVAVYRRRMRDAAFAAKWAHAEAEARVRMNLLLIDAVEVALDPALVDMPEADEREPVTVDQAIAIVRLLDARDAGKLDGRARWRGKAPVEPPVEEARAAILQRIEAIERFERGQGAAGVQG